MTNGIDRRDFLKKVGLACASLAVIPITKAEGITPKITANSEPIRCIEDISGKIHELAHKSESGLKVLFDDVYIALPSNMIADMQKHICQSGLTSYEVLRKVHPQASIVENTDIDVVFDGEIFRKGRLPKNMGAVIDRRGYGDNLCPHSFLYFECCEFCEC